MAGFSLVLALCFNFLQRPALAGDDAFALYGEGRFKEAARAFGRKALEEPCEPVWRYNRGVAAARAGDWNLAAAAFSSARARVGEKELELSFRSYYNLGCAAFKKGDFASAAKYFTEALAIRPDEDAKANLQLALWRKAEQFHKKQQKTCPNGNKKQARARAGKKKPDEASSKNKEQRQASPGQRAKTGLEQAGRPKAGRQQPESDQAVEGQSPSENGTATKATQGRQNSQAAQNVNLEGRLASLSLGADQKGAVLQKRAESMRQMEKNRAESLLDNAPEAMVPAFFLLQKGARAKSASTKNW